MDFDNFWRQKNQIWWGKKSILTVYGFWCISDLALNIQNPTFCMGKLILFLNLSWPIFWKMNQKSYFTWTDEKKYTLAKLALRYEGYKLTDRFLLVFCLNGDISIWKKTSNFEISELGRDLIFSHQIEKSKKYQIWYFLRQKLSKSIHTSATNSSRRRSWGEVSGPHLECSIERGSFPGTQTTFHGRLGSPSYHFLTCKVVRECKVLPLASSLRVSEPVWEPSLSPLYTSKARGVSVWDRGAWEALCEWRDRFLQIPYSRILVYKITVPSVTPQYVLSTYYMSLRPFHSWLRLLFTTYSVQYTQYTLSVHHSLL